MSRRGGAAPGPIYAIADAEALAPTPVPEAVRRIAAAGVRWIQVRAKRLAGGELYRVVEESLAAAAAEGAVLWVDDRADLAALFPVAGVHLGQADLPPGAARRVVGEAPWIGLSTHDAAQLQAADEDAAVDVVAVGPVFPTRSKEAPDPVVGLPFVTAARAGTAKTLVAIGGIDAGNVAAVLAAGADAAAVLAAVCRGDLVANCRRLLRAAEGR